MKDRTRTPGPALAAPRRNHYYYAKMMDVLHFEMEQRYGQEMRWLGNRLTVGSGVLCGLEVAVTDGALWVGPGAAIDPLGREILVPVATAIDLAELDPRGAEPGPGGDDGDGRTMTLSVCYRECLTDHAPVLVSDCQTGEPTAAGTVVETFRFELEEGLPDRAPGICERCGPRLFPRGPKDGPGPITGVEMSVVGTIPIDGSPAAVAASPGGRVVVVLNELEQPAIHVVDVETLVMKTLAPAEVSRPVGGVSFAPDGGPALVTSATGVAVVDVSGPQPRLTAALLRGKRYGRCAAARGGALLFAIDLQRGDVDCIDVAESKVRRILDVKRSARDLAVSGDGRWLFVTCGEDDRILRFDIADLTAPTDLGGFDTTDPMTSALALRGQGAGWEPFVARLFELRAVQAGGPRELELADVEARGIAFSSDGALLYLASARSRQGERRDELVVYDAAEMVELARVPTGVVPASIAVVPGRLRAFVANLEGRSVTVVDGRVTREEPGRFDRRRALCRCTAGPCPPPAGCCVPLAAIRVGRAGRIERVDACAVRRRLYSNEVLLDLILCLAERMDECCEHRPAPAPAPAPSDPIDRGARR